MIQRLLQQKVPDVGIFETGVKGVIVSRVVEPIVKSSGVLPPSICLIGKGRKELAMGDEKFEYDENKFLLGSLKVPVVGNLLDVSEDNPYLGLSILIDPSVINVLLMEFDQFQSNKNNHKAEGFLTTVELTDAIKDPIIRLLKIIGNPMDEKVLGPGLVREIYYQILKSEAGAYLKNCATSHSRAHQIAPIVHYLEKHIKDEVTIDDISREVGMSASALHENFKRATSLSPMQYLKKLRLNNARSLIISGMSVSEAAMNSGYNSATQFSREFKREFGCSPSSLSKRGSG